MLYRKQLMLSATNFIFMASGPFVGAVFMGYLFAEVHSATERRFAVGGPRCHGTGDSFR